MYGLPVVAHRHPVMEYVIGKEETLVDLDRPGSLAAALSAAVAGGNGDSRRRQRWESVRDRFSWQKLAADYVKMFQAVSYRDIPDMPLSLVLLFLLCLGGLWLIFAKPQRIFTYPGLICAAFTVFILPQAVALNLGPGGLSPEEVDDVLLMSALCLGGAYAGWCLRPMSWILRIYQKPLDEPRLVPVALLLSRADSISTS